MQSINKERYLYMIVKKNVYSTRIVHVNKIILCFISETLSICEIQHVSL